MNRELRYLEGLLGHTATSAPSPLAAQYEDFDAFCDEIELLTGKPIDGHEDRDGQSLSSAYDCWLVKITAQEYADGKRAT